MTPKCIIENYFVKEIACGQHHLLIHTLDGKILGMGSNKFGQLGTSDKRFFTFPCLIPIKEIPNQIFSGWNFSGCLTSSGNVYIWGRCDMGQLGVDPQFDQEKYTDSVKKVRMYPSPCLNISLKNISKVVAGSEFCLAIDNISNCFSWGWNEHGNCGCGHNQNIYHPTQTTSGLSFIAAGYGFGFSCNE